MRSVFLSMWPMAWVRARRLSSFRATPTWCEWGPAAGLVICLSTVLSFAAPPSYGQLIVDRTSGAISLATSAAVQVNGYSISSNHGLLSPDAWSSLADQEIDGWFEANPRNQMLSELNPSSSVDPSAGSLSLGNAYLGTSTNPAGEDLTLQYSLTDGSVVDGTVEYTGPINDLVLRVDPDSGAANLELLSGNVGPFDIIGYSIFSDSGALAEGNLTGLGEGWTPASPTSNALAELFLDGSMVFTTNTTAALGNIFKPGSDQDLRLEFATAGLELLQGTVTYGTGVAPPARLEGDADGDGDVDFDDFVMLSNTFNQAVDPPGSGADFSGNGVIDFDDFVALSNNFGQTAAAAVPEPTSAGLSVLAVVLLATVGRRRRQVATLVLLLMGTCLISVGTRSAIAADFETRMILLDPNDPGPNATIDSAMEARGILNGTVLDVNILEDVTGTVGIVDFAGGGGALGVNNPYPNDVADETLNDFAVQVTAFLEIPAGDWNIAFNSDDGGIINMPRVEFLTKTNENAPTGAAGELVFNAPRGAGTWTSGSFTVPVGQTLKTEFEVIMFERAGGDLLEVAILDGEVQGNSDWNQFGIELEDGALEWKLLESGPAAGDFNWDDEVDFGDFVVLANNFGTGTSFAQGDNNRDGRVDLHDFVEFLPLMSAPANAAAVPEPASGLLFALTGIGMLHLARRRRRE